VSLDEIQGALIWPFLVSDDAGRFVLSSEKAGGIVMSELVGGEDVVGWQTVLAPDDIGGGIIVDHWHVFAHGFHWIAVNTTTNRTSYLAKISPDFKLVGWVKVAENVKLNEREYITTNDLFLVDEADGVTVGHFLPGTGHRLFRYDTDLRLIGTKDIGGGTARHANGSSALRTDERFLVFASENLNPAQTGGVRLLSFDQNWNLTSNVLLLSEAKKNISMATGTYLPDGTLVVHAKVTNVANVPSTPGAGGLPDDSGAILRYRFSDALELLDTEVLEESTARHPHTTFADGILYTVWDANKASWLRKDEVR
jgi:hypothetical protein